MKKAGKQGFYWALSRRIHQKTVVGNYETDTPFEIEDEAEQNLSTILKHLIFVDLYLSYRGFHEKGSGDVVSLFVTLFTIYLSLFKQTAETTSPEHFSRNLLYFSQLSR